MTTLFLLDRGSHSIGFAKCPDPSLVCWFDFDMLELPIKKFGCIKSIPDDELFYYIKKEFHDALRAIEDANPSVVVSTGRACRVHAELINTKSWRGKNVFVDVKPQECKIPKYVLKKHTLFVSSDDGAGDGNISSSPVPSLFSYPIEATKIDMQAHDHFF